MKQSIFDLPVRESVITRISNLSPASTGRWGKLTAAQMIRHLTEAGRMAFNEVQVPDQSNVLTRTVVKWLFLRNVKPPGREKGKIKTFPQVDVVALAIPVRDLSEERNDYIALLQRINTTEELNDKHPLFGKMSRDDWGYLTFAHADYHLTQFSL